MALVGLKADSVYECSATGRTHVLFSLGTIGYPFFQPHRNPTVVSVGRKNMEDYLIEHGYHGRVEEMGRAVIFEAEHADDAILLYLAFA